jgi:hypothetical protein
VTSSKKTIGLCFAAYVFHGGSLHIGQVPALIASWYDFQEIPDFSRYDTR